MRRKLLSGGLFYVSINGVPAPHWQIQNTPCPSTPNALNLLYFLILATIFTYTLQNMVFSESN